MPIPGSQSPAYVSRARVISTDPETHQIDIKYMGSDRGTQRVDVVSDFGNYSFPLVGDIVLVVDDGEHTYCLGKIEYGFKNKTEGKVIDKDKNVLKPKKVPDGETYIGNLTKNAWLAINGEGDFTFTKGGINGVKYTARSKLLELAGGIIHGLANGCRLRLGSILTDLGMGDQPIPEPSPPASGTPAIDFLVNIFANVAATTIGIAKFNIGHVKNALSPTVNEFSAWKVALRALLEVYLPTGTPAAALKMDMAGNVELSSTAGMVMFDGLPVGGLLLGGLAATHPAVFGDVLMTWLNAHVHPTSQGPSGTPIVPAEVSMLSTKVLMS